MLTFKVIVKELISWGQSSYFTNSPSFSNIISFGIFGTMAVGISLFVLVATDTENAPAAVIALGLIINE